MSSSIRRMLWGAFAGLALLTAAGVAFTIAVLRMEQRQEYVIVQQSRPLIDAVRDMDEALNTMVSAARGYILSGQTAFTQQHDDAAREFDTAAAKARSQAEDPQDRAWLDQFQKHVLKVRQLTAEQIRLRKEEKPGAAADKMMELAELRRGAQDFAGLITDRIRTEQSENTDRIANTRQWLMMAVMFFGAGIIAAGAMATWRVEQALRESISRQGKRTEAIVGGMADGVMLVDGEGRTVFINPAGQRLLG